MKVALSKLAKLLGETVEALEGLQGSVLPDGADVDLEASVLGYCNWLRSGGKAKQSIELEFRQEQLAKLRADRKFAEAKASGMGSTLSECASVLGVKVDTLKKWHGQGCPGEKDGTVWQFDVSKVFAWRIERERELCKPKPQQLVSQNGEGDIDSEYERARKDREMADKLSLQNARSRGELVEVASVRRLGQQVMSAVRNRILSMPLTDEEKDGCLRELLGLSDMDWSREG